MLGTNLFRLQQFDSHKQLTFVQNSHRLQNVINKFSNKIKSCEHFYEASGHRQPEPIRTMLHCI